MKHYQSLDEAFEELREPNMDLIEGSVEINGQRYHIDGMTIHLQADKPENIQYSIWIDDEKKKDESQKDESQLKFSYPDYFPTENF